MDIAQHDTCPELPQATQESAGESRNGLGKQEILKEMKKQLLLAGPLVSVNLSFCFIQVISITFLGHLGELALSGASIANSFASMACYTLLRGMGSALETFAGQSYGAKEYHMLGILLQRAMIVLLFISIPIGIVFANTADILKFFRQNPEISAVAGQFACFLIPGNFGIVLLECHVRFLQTQNNVVPMMISAGMTTLLHILICWILVFKSGLGISGAALANDISYWIIALSLIFYVWFAPSCKETWTGFTKDALHGIPRFLKLAIPSTIMFSLEVWSLEIMVLLSGLLPNPKLETAVLSISFNIYMLVSMIHLGLGSAVSTRVSNELGAGRPQAARLAACIVVVMVVTVGIIAAIVMITGHGVWGYLYSKERRVVKYVGEMLFLLAASQFVSGIQSVLSGTCRGCGLQKVGAFINFGAYYFIGIPSAIVLAFIYRVGGKGLWIGIIMAQFMQAFSLSIIILCTDWEKQANKAKDRVNNTMIIRDAEASL